MPFTARLGTNLTKPGNIALGGGVFNPVRRINLASAQLTFSGTIPSVILQRLLYSGAATVIVQMRSKALKAQRRATFVLQTRGVPLKVVQRTTTQLDTQPLNLDIAVTETYPYQVDVTQYLASGDTISAISAVLTLTSTGQTAPTGWQGQISTAGNVIQVPINGNFLRLGQVYMLATTFTANTNKILTILTFLNLVA
jgi:hypothetical protein